MAIEVECPMCSAMVRTTSGQGGTIRCPDCRTRIALTGEPVRTRAAQRDEDEENEEDEPRPKRKRKRKKQQKKRASNTGIVLGVCLAVGVLFLVVTVGVFFLVKGGASVAGPTTYPDLTPEQFNSAVKAGMTEEQAVAALGRPTRRQPIAVRYERGGAMGGWTEPVKTDGIRLTWVIYSTGNTWKSCWADLDRDGGKIVSTGSGGGSSN